jgi:hypothetical protein
MHPRAAIELLPSTRLYISTADILASAKAAVFACQSGWGFEVFHAGAAAWREAMAVSAPAKWASAKHTWLPASRARIVAGACQPPIAESPSRTIESCRNDGYHLAKGLIFRGRSWMEKKWQLKILRMWW